MSDAADRRIAELEAELSRLRTQLENGRDVRARMHEEFESLKKQLVERDVYEAQQILPPEQAALIKHLATVERCIEEGPREAHYADDSECQFCGCREGGGHEKTCAWLALQFDRKPAETMAMVEGWAWEENARRDRARARAMTPQRLQGVGLNVHTLNSVFKELWPIERVQDVPAGSALLDAVALGRQRGKTDMVDAALYGNAQIAYRREYLGVFPNTLETEPKPATVAADEAPQHPGLEGEPRRARGGEDDQEGIPPVDHRPPDGER